MSRNAANPQQATTAQKAKKASIRRESIQQYYPITSNIGSYSPMKHAQALMILPEHLDESVQQKLQRIEALLQANPKIADIMERNTLLNLCFLERFYQWLARASAPEIKDAAMLQAHCQTWCQQIDLDFTPSAMHLSRIKQEYCNLLNTTDAVLDRYFLKVYGNKTPYSILAYELSDILFNQRCKPELAAIGIDTSKLLKIVRDQQSIMFAVQVTQLTSTAILRDFMGNEFRRSQKPWVDRFIDSGCIHAQHVRAFRRIISDSTVLKTITTNALILPTLVDDILHILTHWSGKTKDLNTTVSQLQKRITQNIRPKLVTVYRFPTEDITKYFGQNVLTPPRSQLNLMRLDAEKITPAVDVGGRPMTLIDALMQSGLRPHQLMALTEKDTNTRRLITLTHLLKQQPVAQIINALQTRRVTHWLVRLSCLPAFVRHQFPKAALQHLPSDDQLVPFFLETVNTLERSLSDDSDYTQFPLTAPRISSKRKDTSPEALASQPDALVDEAPPRSRRHTASPRLWQQASDRDIIQTASSTATYRLAPTTRQIP